jgi:hypothetical protein
VGAAAVARRRGEDLSQRDRRGTGHFHHRKFSRFAARVDLRRAEFHSGVRGDPVVEMSGSRTVAERTIVALLIF